MQNDDKDRPNTEDLRALELGAGEPPEPPGDEDWRTWGEAEREARDVEDPDRPPERWPGEHPDDYPPEERTTWAIYYAEERRRECAQADELEAARQAELRERGPPE